MRAALVLGAAAGASAACWGACKSDADCGSSCANSTCWAGVCDPCHGKSCDTAACPSDCTCSFSFCAKAPAPTPAPPLPPPPPPGPKTNCTITITSKLADPVFICRSKGPLAKPGNDAMWALEAGKSVTYACPVTADPPGAGDTFQTYFTVRNTRGCPADTGCANGTASCHTYPWAFSGNVGDQHEGGGRYYTALYANHDGDIPGHPAGALPTGWTGDYSSAAVGYKVSVSCVDDKTGAALDMSCGPDGKGAKCSPSQPYCPGFADSGIHTCKIGAGAGNIQMTLS